MDEKLIQGKTREELLAEANKLYVEAALMLTKLDRRMKRAVRLVLIHGRREYEAAALVKRPRQNVHRAVARVRDKLELVKAGA